MTKPQPQPQQLPAKSKKKRIPEEDVVEYTSFGKVNLSQNARDLASMVSVSDPKSKKKKSSYYS